MKKLEAHRGTPITVLGRLSLALCALTLSGCATVTKGMHETITVITEPPGARAYTDVLKSPNDIQSAYIGCEPTPCSFKLLRRTEAVILIEHDDYAPYEAAVFSDHSSERRYREKKRLKEAAARQASHPTAAVASARQSLTRGTTASLAETANVKDPLIRDNVAFGGAASTGIITGAAVLESGTALAAPMAGGAFIGGSMILFGAASYTLAADTTDAVTGADHSIYPNPLFIRLAKDPAQYSIDPNVDGVRQRRRKPSPKAPLNPTQSKR